MARSKRKESATKIYNVTIKGANSQMMFYDGDDYDKFLESLEKASKNCKVKLGARVMMCNHVHLVIHGELDNMARFFKSLGACYVYYYNQKYMRTGPLWNGRFYSDPLESLEAYMQATAYIYNNPVAAKIAESPIDYLWSNFRELFEQQDAEGRKILSEAGDPDEILQYTLDYSEQKRRENCEIIKRNGTEEHFKDDELVTYVKHLIGGASITNIINIGEKVQHNILSTLLDLGSSTSQISRVTGIALGRINALLK